VQWSPSTRIPSPEESSSWFPDLTVDSQGNVHVVWNETATNPEGGQLERVFYSMWNGQTWSPYNDILPTLPDIIRNAITIDNADHLHMTYRASRANLYHFVANAKTASSAAQWSEPRLVNTRRGTYMSDVIWSGGTLHVLYDDRGADLENSPCRPGTCADIYYRKSPDGGQTWENPISLFPTDAGSARAQVEIDSAGLIHAAWDEGWDRATDDFRLERYGVYTLSADNGRTWSEPTLVTYPNMSNTQLTVGSDGKGGIMLVWRTVSRDYPEFFSMWSTDNGQTWQPPRAIPGILSRGGEQKFDMYDMATDSAGNIHLLVVGHLPGERELAAVPGLYHLVWDGTDWSSPMPLFEGAGYPEYPHLVIHQGNQLHATWFVRATEFDSPEPHTIWYASGQTNAPLILPTPTPSPSPTRPASTSTPTATPIPTATLSPELTEMEVPEGAVDAIYSENDELLLLLLSLFPAAALIGLIVVIIRVFRR
jgi:hypothetical protein